MANLIFRQTLSFITLISCYSALASSNIKFFGEAKVKPANYVNFDFNNDKQDSVIVNEGGLVKGGHVRTEIRLGWESSGDNWKVKVIAESDVIMEKDTADRSFYLGSEKESQPNSGGEFGIERSEFIYTFFPELEAQAGWDVRSLDLGSGGLLFADDHPFVGIRGKFGEEYSYELLYIPIQNRVSLATDPTEGPGANDWTVYTLKANRTFKDFQLSPIVALSDNFSKQATVQYFGLEFKGNFGSFNPSIEVVKSQGEFENGNDISSLAYFIGVEIPISKTINPYVALRHTQGDSDSSDSSVEGWVGITDVGRFTPLMGMDGNILGEDMGQSYGATIYSYSPERAVGTNKYGGGGNGSSGDNPGQRIIAVGSKGYFSDKFSYKTQVFFIDYDQTGNLVNSQDPAAKVSSSAGTTFDLQLAYKLSENFSVDYIFSTFVPGDGLKQQLNSSDNAMLNAFTLAWKY